MSPSVGLLGRGGTGDVDAAYDPELDARSPSAPGQLGRAGRRAGSIDEGGAIGDGGIEHE